MHPRKCNLSWHHDDTSRWKTSYILENIGEIEDLQRELQNEFQNDL